ncbi:hypothetical protein H7R52_03995 [Weissella confusa]|uniref:Uncharacterized protein n=1 Tax=Weissella confusa TaxID=1583 RepID=A0A923SNY2_WEICO|nr:hypothetical protein [Weissella confusa]
MPEELVVRLKPILLDLLRRTESYTLAELKVVLLYLNYLHISVRDMLQHTAISSGRYYTFINGQGDITVHKLHAILKTLNVGLAEIGMYMPREEIADTPSDQLQRNLKKPDVILFFALYIKLSSEEKNTCVKLPECK